MNLIKLRLKKVMIYTRGLKEKKRYFFKILYNLYVAYLKALIEVFKFFKFDRISYKFMATEGTTPRPSPVFLVS